METRHTGLQTCMGCSLPIQGEPMTHDSAINVLFVAHDFECLMTAYKREVELLCRLAPQRVEDWLDATACP